MIVLNWEWFVEERARDDNNAKIDKINLAFSTNEFV